MKFISSLTNTEYFEDIIDIVENNFNYIVFGLLAVIFLEFIIFLLMAIKRKFKTDGFYITIFTTLLITLGLYMLLCIVVGFINYSKEIDWNLWRTFVDFLQTQTFIVIIGILAVISLIITAVIFIRKFGLIGGLFASYFGSGIVMLILVIISLPIMFIVRGLAIIAKLLWFTVTAIPASFKEIVGEHWQQLVFCIVVPTILVGMFTALRNYIRSVRDEVFWR